MSVGARAIREDSNLGDGDMVLEKDIETMGDINEDLTVYCRNEVEVSGEILDEPEVKFSTAEYTMVEFRLKVRRYSDAVDTLLIIVDKRKIKGRNIGKGDYCRISGSIRTYKNKEAEEEKAESTVNVYANSVEVLEDEPAIDINDCVVAGELVRTKGYRITKNGTTVIKFVLKVTGKYNKQSFIPCVCWARNADIVVEMEPGEFIRCTGRFQSSEGVSGKVRHEVAVAAIDKIK